VVTNERTFTPLREVAPSILAAWDAPATPPRAVLVLAHGAGGDHRAELLAGLARRLAARGVAVARFDFAYRAAGKKLPAPMTSLIPEYAAVVREVAQRAPGVPVFIGGKSMGGRAATHLATTSDGAGIRGIVLLGYPLHPAGKPSMLRDAHLPDVTIPMLFVQGTRDALCDLELLRPVLSRCGGRATLHVLEDGDHGLEVRKKFTGRSKADAWDEVERVVAAFVDGALRIA